MKRDHQLFSGVIVAPTYNNAATVGDILRQLVEHHLPVIVVDDGSTDGTPRLLHDLQRELAIRVLRHPGNRGKAAALLSGFDAALAMGHSHAITIDTDGQLDPSEIPTLLDAARASPEALIVGVRDETAADYPARSRFGRRFSNLMVRLESGLRVRDSQCGFRVYPLDLVRAVACRAGHYGFETEILTRAGWAGCAVRGVPVSCTYPDARERISHFRPGLDSLRALAMHGRLLSRAMLPMPHPRWRAEPQAAAAPVWRRLADWLNPARAWRDLRQQRVSPNEMAAGVAAGVFIANLPVYGLQTALSLYAARRLHLNPLAVVAGSHLSTPPVGPVLVAAAIGVGHWLLHGNWLWIPKWQASFSGWIKLIGSLMLEWSIGAILVGFILALAAFVISSALFRSVTPASSSADTPAIPSAHPAAPATGRAL